MGIFPEPYTVCHVARLISEEEDPDTGNPVIYDLPPVIRKAMSISQIGRLRGSSKQVYGIDYVKRIESELHIAVADPNVYMPGDQVLLYPEVDENGDYVPATGFAFQVDGVPDSGLTSPWPLLTKALGGMVRLRRVT